MSSIIVYPDRRRLVKLFLGAASVLACAIWILNRPTVPFKVLVCGWLCIPIFGMASGVFLNRLVSQVPSVVVDSKGIANNASWLSVGFIPWTDITGAGITSYGNQNFVGIALHDPEIYLAKVGFLKRYFMRTNASSIGYAVSIPEVTLSMSAKELLSHIRRHFEAYRNSQRAEPIVQHGLSR